MAKQIVVKRKNYPRLIQTYTILTVLLLIAAIVYGYFEYTKLATARAALNDGQQKVTEMTSAVSDVSDQYAQLKRNHDEEFADLRESIEGVFPSEERYTELTRILDDFVLDANEVSPIFMSNLRFNNSSLNEEGNYSVLPFSLNLSATQENLERFLGFVENSGSLETGSRLMDVQSISISFPQQTFSIFEPVQSSSLAESLNISFSMNSYYQAPTP